MAEGTFTRICFQEAQFERLLPSVLSIAQDWELSLDRYRREDALECDLARLYAMSWYRFGESRHAFDHWKGRFYYPFLRLVPQGTDVNHDLCGVRDFRGHWEEHSPDRFRWGTSGCASGRLRTRSPISHGSECGTSRISFSDFSRDT